MGGVKPDMQCNHQCASKSQKISGNREPKREEFIRSLAILAFWIGGGTLTTYLLLLVEATSSYRHRSKCSLHHASSIFIFLPCLCGHRSKLHHAACIFILLPRAPTQQRYSKLCIDCAISLTCILVAQEVCQRQEKQNQQLAVFFSTRQGHCRDPQCKGRNAPF